MSVRESDELRLPFDGGLKAGLMIYLRRAGKWLAVVGLNVCILGLIYAVFNYPGTAVLVAAPVFVVALLAIGSSFYVSSKRLRGASGLTGNAEADFLLKSQMTTKQGDVFAAAAGWPVVLLIVTMLIVEGVAYLIYYLIR